MKRPQKFILIYKKPKLYIDCNELWLEVNNSIVWHRSKDRTISICCCLN